MPTSSTKILRDMASRPSDPLTRMVENLLQARIDPATFNPDIASEVRTTLVARRARPENALKLLSLGLPLIKNHPNVFALGLLIECLIMAIKSLTFLDLAPIPIEAVIESFGSPSEVVQRLGLTYVEKAAETPSGVATLAANDLLIQALFRLYLTSESTEIGATRGLAALEALLKVDSPETITRITEDGTTGPANGQGLLWRRIFQDEGVYQLFFSLTCNGVSDVELSFGAMSTARSRLARLVLTMASLRWDPLVDEVTHRRKTSSIKDKIYCGKSLLDYATFVMIDRTDSLMLADSINFLCAFIAIKEPPDCKALPSIPMSSSPSLEFLISSGVHQGLLEYFLAPEKHQSEIEFIGSARAEYLRYYLKLYPEHFTESDQVKEALVAKLARQFPPERSHRHLGEEDLYSITVMAEIPAPVYMKQENERCCILNLPTSPATVHVYSALAKLFHGPAGQWPHSIRGVLGGSRSDSDQQIAFASRVLFFRSVTMHEDFWAAIGGPMNLTTMPDETVAAFELLRAVITARWADMPEDSLHERMLIRLWGAKPTTNGVKAVIESGQLALDNLCGHYAHLGRVDARSNAIVRRLENARHSVGGQMLELMQKGIGKEGCDPTMWENTLEDLEKRFSVPQNIGSRAMVGVVGAGR